MNDELLAKRDDRTEPMRPHSIFCDECGGWSSPVIEKVAEHSWFVKCHACEKILASMRGTLGDDHG